MRESHCACRPALSSPSPSTSTSTSTSTSPPHPPSLGAHCAHSRRRAEPSDRPLRSKIAPRVAHRMSATHRPWFPGSKALRSGCLLPRCRHLPLDPAVWCRARAGEGSRSLPSQEECGWWRHRRCRQYGPRMHRMHAYRSCRQRRSGERGLGQVSRSCAHGTGMLTQRMRACRRGDACGHIVESTAAGR